MAELIDILKLGLSQENEDAYNDYAAKAVELQAQNGSSTEAIAALSNLLTRVSNNQPISEFFQTTGDFSITYRILYLRAYDVLRKMGCRLEQINAVLTNCSIVPISNKEDLIDALRTLLHGTFAMYQPFLDADDDVDRFNRVIDRYAEFCKEQGRLPNFIRLFYRFARFGDKIFIAGFRKDSDGWGGKLDLDDDVYPAFFLPIIFEETEPLGFSEIIGEILYVRLKEVGNAESVFPELDIFIEHLHNDAKLRALIQKAENQLKEAVDQKLRREIEAGKEVTESAIIRQMKSTALFENIEGIIYSVFDSGWLYRVMEKTGCENLFPKAVELLQTYSPKRRHFLNYALGKLLGARDSQLKPTEQSIAEIYSQIHQNLETMFGQEVMENLPEHYRQKVPDLETRFFLNRVLSNTTTLAGFAEIQERYRKYLVEQLDFPIIHEMFIERASESRHASAYMSFYMAALLSAELGDLMPEEVIKFLANRLSLTYSFTRRFRLFNEIKAIKYEYEEKEEGREYLYYNGYDLQNEENPDASIQLKTRSIPEQLLILYHLINNKELLYALTLFNESHLFGVKDQSAQVYDDARMDLRGKIYSIIDDKFLDLFSDADDEKKKQDLAAGKFPIDYYMKYEKIRSILIAQFLGSSWDMEVWHLRRKGKAPFLKMSQNDLLRSIKHINSNSIREQYEYKEARENIDAEGLRKQTQDRRELLNFMNNLLKFEVESLEKVYGLNSDAMALLSHTSTKLRSEELKLEAGIKQLVSRLKADMGILENHEPLPLHSIFKRCFDGKYGAYDVKIIKRDKEGNPKIDPETGEDAEKTLTITETEFPELLNSSREKILSLDKHALYHIFYLITLYSIVAETRGSMAFIHESLESNKYVLAADALKEQALENHEMLEYAKMRMEVAKQLAPFEIPFIN